MFTKRIRAPPLAEVLALQNVVMAIEIRNEMMFDFHLGLPQMWLTSIVHLLRASCLTLEIEESEKASSRRELNPVHVEDCEGWWSSGCHGSVAEHWQLKPEVSWIRLPATDSLFTFLYFCLITSKFIHSALVLTH